MRYDTLTPLGDVITVGNPKQVSFGDHGLSLLFEFNHSMFGSVRRPWYAKWWFWTGTAAVGGGAILTAVMLRDEPVTTIDIETPLPSALQFR